MMDELTRTAIDFPMGHGACAAGIATAETLAGGPPSTDLSYVLPGAKAAISFALPLDQGTIPPYLMKKDRLALEKDYNHAEIAKILGISESTSRSQLTRARKMLQQLTLKLTGDAG